MGATARATETPVSTTARGGKSQAAFRTISEVADELDVAQHVLRFWESKFPQVRPLKRGGGRRYYRPEDIELLRDIRSLLYDEGYTIKGAQKLLRQRRAKPPAAAKPPPEGNSQAELQEAELQGTAETPPSPTNAAPAPEGENPGRETTHAADDAIEPVPAAAAPPVAHTASDPRAAASGDLARLQRLRDELLDLRRDVDAALSAADRRGA